MKISCVSSRKMVRSIENIKVIKSYMNLFYILDKFAESLFDQLQSGEFKKFLQTGSENFAKEEKLNIALACLLAFIQDNFTGPDVKESFEIHVDQEKWKIDRIAVDGIEYNENIRNLSLLMIANNFLNDLLEQFPFDLVNILM